MKSFLRRFIIIVICINFNSVVSFASIVRNLNCKKGTLLSKRVCLPYGYLQGEVPKEPTVVTTNIEINNIREVNDKMMRLTLDYYQDLVWVDNRIKTSLLANEVSVLNNKMINYLWKPDLWIKNLFDFKIHGLIEPTSGLVIMVKENCDSLNCTNGKESKKENVAVSYNMEGHATIYCNFRFVNYPMDTQYCQFFMDVSYPYPNIVELRNRIGVFGEANQHSNTDDFYIEVMFDFKRNQSGIHSMIKLERRIMPYIIQYYLPCIAIVCVSMIGFCLSMDSVPARVTLLVTQFLTLTNILIAQQVYNINYKS